MGKQRVIAQRYEILSSLGAGAAAEVFHVFDREDKSQRALKLLHGDGLEDPEALAQAFHREFRLLTELRHPHLVRVHDFGTASLEPEQPARPWYTMDLLPGRGVEEALASGSDWRILARVADAVLDALTALHARGLIHRDVTAANILVGENYESEPPPVWLMDLGLVDLKRQVQGGVVRGTLATIAPETLRGGDIDGRADLYSFGCVLYRLSTGQDPFPASSPWQTLQAHLRTPPRPPRHLNPELPLSLERVILSLLAKEPSDRPATAEAVRRDLSELSGRRIDRIVPLASPLSPSLSGRSREMERFEEALSRLVEGHGDCLLVTGAPGSGRTRLLEEYRLAAQLAGQRGVLVRAGDLEQQPFAVLDAIGSALAEPTSPDLPQQLDPRLEELADSLRDRGGVILVDNVPLADAASRSALLALAEMIAEEELSCLLALSMESGGENIDNLADLMLERGLARVLRLRPIDETSTGRMAASMLGQPELPQGFVARLHEVAGGVPLLIDELVTALVHSGKVGPGATLPANPETLLDGVSLAATRLGAQLPKKWAEFGEPSRALLAALAVAEGEPVSFAQLEQLDPHTALDPEAASPLLQAGLVRRVRSRKQGIALTLATPALAERILSLVDEGAIRSLHRRRADLLAGLRGAEARRASHLLAAGDENEAWPLMVEAARSALRNGTPVEAIRLTDELLSCHDGSLPKRLETRARRLRARALNATGHPDQAEPEFALALTVARETDDPLELAETLRSCGSFLADGDFAPQAIANFEEALALLDELGDTDGGARVLLSMGQLLARRGQHDDAETRLRSALNQARRAGRADIQAEALLALGELALGRGTHEEAGEHFRAAEQEAKRSGSEYGRNAARRGKVLSLEASGRFAEALAAAEDLLSDARDAKNSTEEAEANALAGRLLVHTGRRNEALARLGHAITLHRRHSRTNQLARLQALQARLLLERGQVRTARTRAREARELALRTRAGLADSGAAQILARIEAFLGHDNEVEEILDLLPSATPAARAERSLLLGMACLAGGRTERARELLQETCFLARRAKLRALEAEGLLGLAAAYVEIREVERAGLALKKVRAWAESGGGEETLAMARLIAAEKELAQPGGDMAQAREDAELAARALDERERADLAWRAWAALAGTARRLGDIDAANHALHEALRAIEALLASLPQDVRGRFSQRPRVRALLLQADGDGTASTTGETQPSQHDPAYERTLENTRRLLEINRMLNSTLELDVLLRLLLDTAIDFFAAERGFVLIETGSETQVELARAAGGEDLPDSDRQFSRSVARQVIRDDQALLSHNAQADERLSSSKSIHSLQIHSILAHPLRVRGKVAGAIVVDSRQASSIFDREHQELISRLADQAGIALANASLVKELRQQAEEIKHLNEQLQETVEEQRVEILEKQSNLELRFRYDCIVGASPAMQKTYRSVDKILPTEIPVLISGASGTGKDLIARVLHYNGPRASERFITVNCAALTETLLESELFGHRKGAFTGAERDRKGLFEQADMGTLFLDEIGEMPLHLQPKLLRAIQFGEVRRLGEDSSRNVNVRVLAATNRSLAEMVREGSFREDLYYRLDVAEVALAPLRERMEDIGLLVGHFLEDFAEKNDQPEKKIENAALRLFLRYDWPGNVRELENEVTKLAAFSQGEIITELDILENASFLDRAKVRKASRSSKKEGEGTLEQAEVEQIRQALKTANGNRTRAAEILGIDRSTLYRKLKRLDREFRP